MCIIIVKPKGRELPSNEIFENCWKHNYHGAGFMYHINNKVIIDKGFMTLYDFLKRMSSIKNEINILDTTMVFHFRISTSGNIDKGNCHPYPVSSDTNKLRLVNCETNLAVAHNGIIHNYNETDKQLNDTQLFITYDLYEMFLLDNKFYHNSRLMSIIERLIYGSRLVFLDKSGKFEILGNWIKDNGYLYSNESYLDTFSIKNKPIYKEKIENILTSDYEINGTIVDEEEYELMIDYLETIPYGVTIYLKDGISEYNYYDKNIYIDTVDKTVYHISNNKISYVGEYI